MGELTQRDVRPTAGAADWQDWPLAARRLADGQSVPVEVTITRDLLTIRAERHIKPT